MVGAEEMILCIDDDSSQEFITNVHSLYDRIKKRYPDASLLKVLKVEKRTDYSFHQAWVRRKGFLESKNDIILTGDIDLYINKCVLNAVELVGKDNIGLASVQKFPLQSNLKSSLSTIWRLAGQMMIRKLYHSVFTGLYAFYRPYWIETEDSRIKELRNPKHAGFYSSVIGEDVYLRDCMQRKYRCVYLKCVGAVDYGISLHDNPVIQFTMGRYYFHQGKSLWQVLLAAFLYYHPDSIVGYFYEKERVKKGLAKLGNVI